MFFTPRKPVEISENYRENTKMITQPTQKPVYLAKTDTRIRQDMQFGMISRIQQKTFCFSCGK